jgi:r-opsin
VYAFFLSQLPWFGTHGFVVEGFLTSCSFDFITRDRRTLVIMVIMVTLGFVMPFSLIFVYYSLIVFKIKKYEREAKKLVECSLREKKSFIEIKRDISDTLRKVKLE